MRRDLLRQMTWEDVLEIVCETEAVFDEEVQDGRNPNETFQSPKSYYTEVIRRLRNKYNAVPNPSERFAEVRDVAERATGTKLGLSRGRSDVLVRYFISHQMKREGYSLSEIGRAMGRDHATILGHIRKLDWMLAQPRAYRDEIDKYKKFIEALGDG